MIACVDGSPRDQGRERQMAVPNRGLVPTWSLAEAGSYFPANVRSLHVFERLLETEGINRVQSTHANM